MSERPSYIALVPDDESVPVVKAPPATTIFEDAVRNRHWLNFSNGFVEVDGRMVKLDMFLDMVKQLLIGSNVPENDPRHAFVAYVKDLVLIPGYDGEGQRFAPEEL